MLYAHIFIPYKHKKTTINTKSTSKLNYVQTKQQNNSANITVQTFKSNRTITNETTVARVEKVQRGYA